MLLLPTLFRKTIKTNILTINKDIAYNSHEQGYLLSFLICSGHLAALTTANERCQQIMQITRTLSIFFSQIIINCYIKQLMIFIRYFLNVNSSCLC